MRFKQLIHPEILLNKRGPLVARQVTKEMLSAFEYVPGYGWRLSILMEPELRAILERDDNAKRVWTLMKKWVNDRGQAYHVNRDLLLALSEIRREIPLQVLPEKVIAYVSFAENAIRDDDGFVQGAYIYIGPSSEAPLNPDQITPDGRCLWIAYLNNPVDSTGGAVSCALLTELREGKLQDMMDVTALDYRIDGRTEVAPAEADTLRMRVYAAVVNAICYAYAPESLIETVPPAEQKLKKKHTAGMNKMFNESSLPITFLNWRYKREVFHNKEGTLVDTFGRWQPYGKNSLLRKWIMVQGFPRRFKNVRGSQVVEEESNRVDTG